MLFEVGFLGTKAPFFIDLITSFFILLPFFVLYSIFYAKNGLYEKHIKLQIYLFTITIILSTVFEVLIRINGGFFTYSETSMMDTELLKYYFFIHIIIATITLVFWFYLILISIKSYKKNGLIKRHIILGNFVFYAICATSIMGTIMYMFLFLVQ